MEPFADRVLQWFDQNGRHDLPWQIPNLYARWISEIMLQQTQVATVIPYYDRFMRALPDVNALAKADEDTVLSLWTGLGYYTRARNLHQGAQYIVDTLDAHMPTDIEQWQQIPGVGRSTAAAIVSQALDEVHAILDANVKRVLARHAGIATPPNAKTTAALWQISNDCLPDSRGADYTQAIMDLGATRCTPRNPQCDTCPVTHDCYARAHSLQHALPQKKTQKVKPTKTQHWALISGPAGVLLHKNTRPSGVWRGLWLLPSFDTAPTQTDIEAITLRPRQQTHTQTIKHTFSHYHLIAEVSYWTCEGTSNHVTDGPPKLWYDCAHPPTVGLAQPIQKLLEAHI